MSEETCFAVETLRACEMDILQSDETKSENGTIGMKKPDETYPVFLCVMKTHRSMRLTLFDTGREMRQQILHEHADILCTDRIHAVHRIPETGREGDFPVFQLRAQHF